MICSFKGYQEVWCTSDRCVRLQHSSARDHAKGMAQKAAFDKDLGSQDLTPRDRREKEQYL